MRYHWYTGEGPPLVIAAVKVTEVPEQMLLPWLERIEIVGAAVLFTVMEITLLWAIAGAGHVSEEVISQLTTSPLFSVDVM